MLRQREKGSPRFGEAKYQTVPGEAGQVLLIVILVIIIASTIGLSLASRSITSLRTSSEEAESQKALAAAEAGIERAIQGSIPIALQGENPSNNSRYFTQFTQVQSASFLINGGNVIPKDEGADVWFVGHNADGTPDYSSALSPNFLHLYWGSPLDACGSATAPAAIQAIVISRNKNTGEIKSYRYAYDSCTTRISGNNFTVSDSGSFTVTGISKTTFGNRTPEAGASSDLAKGVNDIVFMRVIPIYKDAVIGVNACNRAGNNCTSLPSQGYIISSTGTSGAANRKLTVFKGYPQTYLPYLSYGLFVAN
jgi:type II secretory pathway pseudopilin PulG